MAAEASHAPSGREQPSFAQRSAPQVAIGAGSIERAALSARSATLFAHRLAAFRSANAKFLASCADPASSDDETDALCDQAHDACYEFAATPAANHAGISRKIAVLMDWHDGTKAPLDIINNIAADAAALLAEGEVDHD